MTQSAVAVARTFTFGNRKTEPRYAGDTRRPRLAA